MLGLFLNWAIIFGLASWLAGEDAGDYMKAVWVALAVGVTSFACAFLLGPTLGIFSILPAVALLGFLFMLVYGLPAGKAALGTAIYCVLAFLISWGLAMLAR